MNRNSEPVFALIAFVAFAILFAMVKNGHADSATRQCDARFGLSKTGQDSLHVAVNGCAWFLPQNK